MVFLKPPHFNHHSIRTRGRPTKLCPSQTVPNARARKYRCWQMGVSRRITQESENQIFSPAQSIFGTSACSAIHIGLPVLYAASATRRRAGLFDTVMPRTVESPDSLSLHPLYQQGTMRGLWAFYCHAQDNENDRWANSHPEILYGGLEKQVE
jgi:hypothetical protein